jgi:hypothetical protein
LIRNFVDAGKHQPPPDRGRDECEQVLRDFLGFLTARINAAVPSYYAKNSDIPGGLEGIRRILSHPMDGDEMHYYGLLKETLELGAKDLQEGIHKTVHEFHQTIDSSKER